MRWQLRGDSDPRLSFAAALLIPFCIALSLRILGSAGLLSLPWLWLLAAGCLLALGICLLPAIHPLIFGPMLIVTIPAMLFAQGREFRSGNLFGLVLVLTCVYALIVAATSTTLGLAIRRRHQQRWTPAAAIFLSLAIVAAGAAKVARESTAIVDRLHEISRAEQAYADTHPNHLYTCSGPELPGLSGIEWSAAANLGLREKSHGRAGIYWIQLQCSPYVQPKAFIIRAFGAGRQFSLDSNGSLTTAEAYR